MGLTCLSMMATIGATSADTHSASSMSDVTRHGRDEVAYRDSAVMTDLKIRGGLYVGLLMLVSIIEPTSRNWIKITWSMVVQIKCICKNFVSPCCPNLKLMDVDVWLRFEKIPMLRIKSAHPCNRSRPQSALSV